MLGLDSTADSIEIHRRVGYLPGELELYEKLTGREILDILAAQHERGLTVVMVTHDRTIAARADRVVELHDGQVV